MRVSAQTLLPACWSRERPPAQVAELVSVVQEQAEQETSFVPRGRSSRTHLSALRARPLRGHAFNASPVRANPLPHPRLSPLILAANRVRIPHKASRGCGRRACGCRAQRRALPARRVEPWLREHTLVLRLARRRKKKQTRDK